MDGRGLAKYLILIGTVVLVSSLAWTYNFIAAVIPTQVSGTLQALQNSATEYCQGQKAVNSSLDMEECMRTLASIQSEIAIQITSKSSTEVFLLSVASYQFPGLVALASIVVGVVLIVSGIVLRRK